MFVQRKCDNRDKTVAVCQKNVYNIRINIQGLPKDRESILGEIMKKMAAFLMSAFLLASSTACANTKTESSSSSERTVSVSAMNSVPTTYKSQKPSEVHAYWVSYLDIQTRLQTKSEEEAKKELDQIIENIESVNGNTIFLQVRPYGDALYNSSIFPASHIANGTQGEAYSFDVLEYVIEKAHEKNIQVHAWINPFRVKESTRPPSLSKDNPAQKWLEEESRNVIELDSGIYYNPANEEVRDLIISGVKEIVENYDVDGVQFDDYFYPTTETSFDAPEYKAYQLEGGALTLNKWREDNVNQLIKETYSSIKEINPSVQFGISPMANIEQNYTEQYADVKTWASKEGYVDYLMPQLYFGFLHTKLPYEETLNQWAELVEGSSVELMVGLAVYKIGVEDQWAGDEGKVEWTTDQTILSRQITLAREENNYAGVGFYRYDSVFAPDSEVSKSVEEEMKNVYALPNWEEEGR